jgi:hypothetical protein
MMEISGEDVNVPVLDRWISRLNLAAEWTKARSLEGRE